MNTRPVERATRNHSRQRGFGSNAFDRCTDSRERRAARHGASAAFVFGSHFGDRVEVERRSLLDTFAPARS